MDGIPEEKWLRWKRKRRNTLIGFIIIGTIAGIDDSAIFSTLYLYLRDVIKTNRPELYYGLIIAFFFISSGVSGAFSGRWLDKTRRVRYYANFSLLIQAFGFILYVIPYHPSIQLVARIICGIGEPFPIVVTGEVFRIYDNEGSNRAMFWLASVYSFGFIIGPSLNFIFKGIEFKIGTLHINYLNFIAIFMAGLIIIILILTNFLIHDCSAEIDLKELLKNTEQEATNKEVAKDSEGYHLMSESAEVGNSSDKTNLITSTQETIPPVRLVVKNLASNTDTVLIFIATFIFVYAVSGASIYFPVLISINLKWGITAINIAYYVNGVTYILLNMLLSKYCTSNKSVYYTCLVSIVSLIVSNCLLICFKLLERDMKRDVCLMILFIISLVLAWCVENVLMKIMLANVIPSNIQSFGETLRSGVSKVAIIGASFTASFVAPILHWWAGGMSIIIILILVGFVIRRNYLINPQCINFTEDIPVPPVRVNYGACGSTDL